MDNNKHADTTGFLPDFCDVRTLFAVVLIAELLVFVLVLAQPSGVNRWQALGLYSLYVQWIALGCAVVLCLLRTWLARMRPAAAGIAAWLLILVITGTVTWVARGLVLESGTRPGEYLLRSVGVAALVSAVALRYLYLQRDWRRRVESASAARVQALQARIRPHFLFNSLNTIASMIRGRPAEAETAVEDLAELFRASLETGDGLTQLDDELRLAEGYLHMEQLRLGERLHVHWEVEELPRDALLPPLTLQPLLENAVYHGIEPRREGGTIRIRGSLRETTLRLCVDNPVTSGATGRPGHGMALDNVRERLRLAFGDAAQFHVHRDGETYTVCLELPWYGAGQGESEGDAHAHTDRG